MKRDIIDRLYKQALDRYREEKPDFVFTKSFTESLYYSILGIYDREGSVAAEEYVKNGVLLKKTPRS